MKHHHRSIRRIAAAVAALSLVAAACGDDEESTDDAAAETAADATADAATAEDASASAEASAPAETGEPVEIDWWHIQNNEPGVSDWQAMADAYMAEHPNVTINITVMENEAFKAALQTNIQSGDIPDLFQSWGGGGLRDQVAAGIVRDISAEAAPFLGDLGPAAVGLYQVEGKQYGVPFDAGMVGIWYNRDLFAQAGVEPPATWEELLTAVQTLKDAGITPIAVGAGDKWPAHFWYSYLMVRECGADEMTAMAADNNFSRDCVIEAGRKVSDLVALDPFQEGFLGAGWDAPDGESGTMASQGAAMDLMGQWAPGAFRAQAGITDAATPLEWEIGWFPFPSVDGGAGGPTDAFGGGNGFAVGKDAPAEAVDFLGFITNAENQRTWARNSGLPVNTEAGDAVADPNMQAVLEGLNTSTFLQLYLDQYFTAEVGAVVNDQTALLFAGEISPEDAAAAITTVAGG